MIWLLAIISSTLASKPQPVPTPPNTIGAFFTVAQPPQFPDWRPNYQKLVLAETTCQATGGQLSGLDCILPPPPPAPTPVAAPPAPDSSHNDLLAAAGIAPSDWVYADNIITRESGWRWWVVNAEGATGLPQALPGSKMATAGADWATNPVTQLRWMAGYVNRYGGFAGAWTFWQTHHYY